MRTENRTYESAKIESVADLERLSNEVLPMVECLEPLAVDGATFEGKRGVVAIKPNGERVGLHVTGTQTPQPTSHTDLLDAFVMAAKERGHESLTGTVLVDDLGSRFRAQLWLVDADPKLNEPHRVGFELRSSYETGETTVAGALQTLVCSNGMVATRHIGQHLSAERTRRTGRLEPLVQTLPAMMNAAWEALDEYLPKYDAWREAAKTLPLPKARQFLTKDMGLPAATALKVVDAAGYLDEERDTSINGLPSIVQVHDALTQLARDAIGGTPEGGTVSVPLGAAQYDRFQEAAVLFREKLPLTEVIAAQAKKSKKA